MREIGKFASNVPVTTVHSLKNNTFVTLDEKVARVWSLSPLECVQTIQLADKVVCCAPWEDNVIFGLKTGHIVCYSLKGTLLWTCSDHKECVHRVILTPTCIVSCSTDR